MDIVQNMFHRLLPLLFAGISLFSLPSHAEGVFNLEELTLEELLEVPLIRVATGTQKTLAKAPAIASVITSKDMEEMGARYLHEALSSIPGLFVGRSLFYYNPLFIIRGISSEITPHTLFLLNGKTHNTDYGGTLGVLSGNIPVQMIKRIEIIRGPGSALYGANAFAGVINIITKNKSDINGTEVGVTGGSFDSYQAWLLHGQKYNKLDTALGIEFTTTHGHREIIERDQQTTFDSNTGTNASFAPGPMNNMSKSIHTHIDLGYEKWKFEVHNKYIYNQGTGAGLSGALDPISKRNSSQSDLSLTYKSAPLAGNWNFKTSLGYMLVDNYGKSPFLLFPPGSDIPPVGDPFPDGVLGDPSWKESRTSFASSLIFKGFPNHTPQAGAEVNYVKFFDIEENKNFESVANTPLPGGLTNVTGTDEVFLPNINRTTYGLYLQDEWSFHNHWELTTGVRFDHFSDFGETVNPRLALVWTATPLFTSKFLYGRAFRAPSIVELHLKNNPVALGNPDLKPETIDNYELAFDFHPARVFSFRINFFQANIKDFIQYQLATVGFQAFNSEDLVVRGMEAEADMILDKTWKLTTNYSFQQTNIKSDKSYFGLAPRSQSHLISHWYFSPEYELNLHLNWTGTFKRQRLDSRPEIGKYFTADMTLHKRDILPETDFILSFFNIFNKSYKRPSSGPSNAQRVPPIPNDIPQAGRSFYMGLKTRF